MDELNKTKLLDHLSFPDDLKDLSIEDLELLASEIRTRLLEIGNLCGGHLASNLGVVEITLVLHTLFNSPTDKFAWDTSHQTYVHKMLTGRLNQMFSIRQEGGLSGFTNIFESEHDSFGAGHASTALSAALGFAHSRELLNQDHKVVAIIGDASLSGGMSFEALNNIERLNSNFICILNDNNMAISKPVGNMSTYMTKIRTSPLYDQAKKILEQFLTTIPQGGSLKRKIEKGLDHLRDLLVDQKFGVMFEEFGFQYIGPIDGHDISMLMAALRYAEHYDGPVLIHAITQKGKGHGPAESDPIKYHGVSPKKAVSLPESKEPKQKVITNSEFFGNTMIDICNQQSDVVVVTPAMIGGSGLTQFAAVHPNKLFDVGIAEEHAVTFVAGLARTGIKPVLAIYSTFLQRGYDQLIHDVCIQNLPVVFALDRAGFAGEDGVTHHGLFDYAYMLPIPNMTILAPKDANEIKTMMHWALNQKSPISLRYPKGAIIERTDISIETQFDGSAELMFQSTQSDSYDISIIAVGSMAWDAYDAAQELRVKGYHVNVINLRSVKPLDRKTLDPFIQASKHILVVEEGSQISGCFSYLIQTYKDSNKLTGQWHFLGVPDQFYDHGKIPSLRKQCQLDKDGIVAFITSLLNTCDSSQVINQVVL
ncbi:1-deoxy-D-xylulose-5-phosphate synthase [bacterium]|nr:1-deoxy-D-xylulose-5-phosphate synthase [bacterium]